MKVRIGWLLVFNNNLRTMYCYYRFKKFTKFIFPFRHKTLLTSKYPLTRFLPAIFVTHHIAWNYNFKNIHKL